LRDGEQKNTGENSSDWESELWSIISQGDGTNCPLYNSCGYRAGGGWCLSEHQEFFSTLTTFIDQDNPNFADLRSSIPRPCVFPGYGRIFKLVQRLADKYHVQAGVTAPPVPSDLITISGDNLPIEVRRIPLKYNHGAVWRLDDCWLIQLNKDDSPARQRFTLYHEIFHILAHSRGTPIFKKISDFTKGSFNEMLADHFAGIMLMPKYIMEPTWEKVRNVDRMADIFGIPKSLAMLAIKMWDLK
jgi:hypothetical protein